MSEASDLVDGIIKWFNPTKGYGFAISNGKDIFVHSKRLRESGMPVFPDPAAVKLETGDKLKFKVQSGPKGDYATNILKV